MNKRVIAGFGVASALLFAAACSSSTEPVAVAESDRIETVINTTTATPTTTNRVVIDPYYTTVCGYIETLYDDYTLTSGELVAIAMKVSDDRNVPINEELGTYLGMAVMIECDEYFDEVSAAADSFGN